VAESRFENKYSASLKVKKGEMPDDKAVISGAGDFIEKEKPSKKQQDKDQPERKKRTNKKVKKKTFPGVIRE